MNRLLILLTPILIVLVDQWSKYMIDTHWQLGESYIVLDGLFNLTYVRNSGAAFSFGGNFPDSMRFLLFKVLPVFACMYLIWELLKGKINNILQYAYAFILGGAIGNLIDRIRLDYVVDMFDFYHGKSHFATFNVADSFITIAAFILVFDMIQNIRSSNEN